MTLIQLQNSDNGQMIEIADIIEMDRLLDEAASKAEAATILYVYAHGCQVAIGVGAEKCFIQFEPASGDPPYLVSVGDPTQGGAFPFYLFGVHHTEIPIRNLITASVARDILRGFVQTGERSDMVCWEEV